MKRRRKGKRKVARDPSYDWRGMPALGRNPRPMGIRLAGAMKSEIICARPGCGQRITLLAEQHGDPYCSRECLENKRYYGRWKRDRFAKGPEA